MGCSQGVHPDELEHALSLLREIEDVSFARYTSVMIDHHCGWPVAIAAGGMKPGKCGRRIDRVTFLRTNARVNVAAYCDHHADCMDAAYAHLKAERGFVGDGGD